MGWLSRVKDFFRGPRSELPPEQHLANLRIEAEELAAKAQIASEEEKLRSRIEASKESLARVRKDKAKRAMNKIAQGLEGFQLSGDDLLKPSGAAKSTITKQVEEEEEGDFTTKYHH